IVISITNPCDVIALYLANMTGFDKAKIIGSGTLIDTNRLKHRAERDDVLVIGEHGESQVALNVSSEVEKLATGTGWEIYAAKHHTAFGISSSVARIIRVLKTDTRELLPVSSYDESENCFYATLTEFNLKDGVIRRILPPLNNSETNRLAQSIQTIKRNYLEI
ncbi:MAG: hypothetical protein ACTH5F_05100, partial [Pseudolactococcus laudensis]